MKKNIFYLFFLGIILSNCQQMNKEIDKVIHTKILYQSNEFTVYNDSVVQGTFVAKAISRDEIISNSCEREVALKFFQLFLFPGLIILIRPLKVKNLCILGSSFL